MTEDRITTLLDGILARGPGLFAIVRALREQVLALDPTIREEVKYGGLLYSTDAPFCGIFAYAGHVSLELSAGALLPDAQGVLEGKGGQRRHIKLRTAEEVESKHVRAYLELAYQAPTKP